MGLAMKAEEPVSPSKKANSPPTSPIARLYRKLSPRRAEKRCVSVDGSSSQCCSLLQRVFDYFDKDGDGKISSSELQSCVRASGGELSAEQAEMAVVLSDSDGDGMLGMEDFGRLIESGGEEERREELKEAFGMYEMEGTGCITPKSLKRMLSQLGNPSNIDDCKAMICRFDLNGDGVLNFEEFRIMMRLVI